MDAQSEPDTLLLASRCEAVTLVLGGMGLGRTLGLTGSAGSGGGAAAGSGAGACGCAAVAVTRRANCTCSVDSMQGLGQSVATAQ